MAGINSFRKLRVYQLVLDTVMRILRSQRVFRPPRSFPLRTRFGAHLAEFVLALETHCISAVMKKNISSAK